jgi:hypothetical protein
MSEVCKRLKLKIASRMTAEGLRYVSKVTFSQRKTMAINGEHTHTVNTSQRRRYTAILRTEGRPGVHGALTVCSVTSFCAVMAAFA